MDDEAGIRRKIRRNFLKEVLIAPCGMNCEWEKTSGNVLNVEMCYAVIMDYV